MGTSFEFNGSDLVPQCHGSLDALYNTLILEGRTRG